MYDSLNDPVGSRILNAFSGPQGIWRSLGGIARDTGLPLDTVYSYFNQHSDLFMQSPLRPIGTPLYALEPGIRSKLLHLHGV